jgi:hypothetical protein
MNTHLLSGGASTTLGRRVNWGCKTYRETNRRRANRLAAGEALSDVSIDGTASHLSKATSTRLTTNKIADYLEAGLQPGDYLPLFVSSNLQEAHLRTGDRAWSSQHMQPHHRVLQGQRLPKI